MLVQMLPREKQHGWNHEIEVLVTIYWLACVASYRVTASYCLPGKEAFRCTAGTIDGCHILGNHIRSYINRKLFPSLVLQGICDSKGTFLDVYIGNCGSVHDALVLRRSPIYKQAIYPPAGFFLLGDGGYPCLKHPVAILSLYRQPVSSKNIIPFSLHLQTQSSATSVTVKHAEL